MKYFWIIFSILIVLPIAPYAYYFHAQEISHSNQDWAAFGSYLSGAYTMCSIGILSWTLYQTQKNNIRQAEYNVKQAELMGSQLNLIKKEQISNEIYLFIKILRESFDNNIIIKKSAHPTNPHAIFNKLENRSVEMIESWDSNSDFFEWVDISISRSIDAYDNFLESEKNILVNILECLSRMDEDDREKFKTLIKGVFTNQQRFWLKEYSKKWSLECRYYLQHWYDFQTTVPKIQEKINHYENPHEFEE
ncbi:MAG: hypothetical protein ACTH8B_10410 [Serratia proteamaculans]